MLEDDSEYKEAIAREEQREAALYAEIAQNETVEEDLTPSLARMCMYLCVFCVCVFIYMYIYIYNMYVYVYIHIYIMKKG